MPIVEPSWLISGNILYFHYGHQGLNDKGWGCAYRSLQCLLSFFSLNHYVDMRVPSIPEIQQVLVDIGDKPASFVNSREWIGSQEVGYVLGSLLDIDCKYIIIEKGSEAKKYMNQLRDHFMNQATPVMIGGGVLAFTCIGISIHPKTQDAKLLILDPHYTGKDEVKSILSEKQRLEGYFGFGCSWKTLKEVFKASEFYRLCLPQRPFAYLFVCCTNTDEVVEVVVAFYKTIRDSGFDSWRSDSFPLPSRSLSSRQSPYWHSAAARLSPRPTSSTNGLFTNPWNLHCM
ncbi:uncharacterized protein [Blastocystis hominis]|uniref:UFSP1/2/DUB catalytic domain-containing protein n=1 Tax=Blastocystis hominis TaxID=12968 RepID=D8M2G7_BLAHO|nr:uncharacterized protein [Blastocystis hominis]CBK22256.2 unnamed protein product [Blastocystis hominis]|eukprot:XP_012896304.1 uncharacterized protein [Blastocystis hominis]